MKPREHLVFVTPMGEKSWNREVKITKVKSLTRTLAGNDLMDLRV